jgi:hypothetical protein
MNMRKLLLTTLISIALAAGLSACKKLPDPVVRKDGYAWIPIADTAFLIPEKTWLKGYGRKSTDGSVDDFRLHATVPDADPWSENVNAQMYPPAGPGKRIDVFVKDDRETLVFQLAQFYKPPQSRWKSSLIEVTSDLESDGLRKFRESGPKGTVFYERIENDRVRYFIYCDDDGGYIDHQFCHLSFPWGKTLYVDLKFTRNYLPHSIRMVEQITAKLKQFEAAAHSHQPNPTSNRN